MTLQEQIDVLAEQNKKIAEILDITTNRIIVISKQLDDIRRERNA